MCFLVPVRDGEPVGSSPVVSLPHCSSDWPPGYTMAGLCLFLLLLRDLGWCWEGGPWHQTPLIPILLAWDLR